MSDAPLSALRPALAGEQDRWLRRRFALYCAVLCAVSAATSAVLAFGVFGGSTTGRLGPMALICSLLAVMIYAAPLLVIARRRRPLSRRTILRLSYAVTLAFAAAFIVPSGALSDMATSALRASGNQGAIGPMGPWFLGFFSSHLLACLIIPWRPREAAISYLPISLVIGLMSLTYTTDPLNVRIIGAVSLLLVGAPGMAVCALRHSRFSRRFHLTTLAGYYEETTQELTSAHRLHEALLPAPIRTDRLVADYAYEPMRAIGGDFLYFHRHDGDGATSLTCILVDVTGHGVPAALTVHRLHGELERIYGEHPETDPGKALAKLNSYFHVALAKHSVYATAFCARCTVGADGRALLRYASAGHPPAYLLAREGGAAELEATCFVLGAAGPEDFDPEPREVALEAGSQVVVYTDGAFECRVGSGEMLGLAGLRRIVESKAPRHDPARAILEEVRGVTGGEPPTDDTLILSIRIPL